VEKSQENTTGILYIDGIKSGVVQESWSAECYILGALRRPLSIDKKLSLKQLRELGFSDRVSASPRSDYYIIREY
jgi:hypothetical protein